MKDTITRTDRDIANTIAKDFHRTVTLDLDNPYDVIRGLKYDSRVLESEEEAQSEKDLREAAIRMLEEGVSIHVVADYFDKSDDWVFSVAKEAESREVWVNYD